MPKVEIDETELRTLRGAQQLLDQLQSNPKTRRPFQATVKTLHPDAITDEDRLQDAPEIKKLNSLEERFDAFIKAQEEKAADNELNASFGRLVNQGYTTEGLGKIKQLMVDRKIADPEAAAALWEKNNPPADIQPTTLFGSTSFGIGHKTDDPDLKLLFEDEDAFAEREFAKVMRGE